MKKIKYLWLISVLLIMPLNAAMADCYTGFACSIADLEKQEQEQIKKNTAVFKQYLEQKHMPHKILVSGKIIKDYNDLFLFNSIY